MAKIGIDVDGVLANFGDAFSEHARTIFGKYKIPQGYVPTDWNWSDVITKDEEAVLWKELKLVKNFWLSPKPFTENVAALRNFIEHTHHDIWFITARAQCAGGSIAEQTQRWLKYELGWRYDNTCGVITVAKPPLKNNMIKAMDIQYFIDDHGPTVEGFDKIEGLDGCLLDRPWNQDAKVNNRVSSMAEFLERVEPWQKKQQVAG